MKGQDKLERTRAQTDEVDEFEDEVPINRPRVEHDEQVEYEEWRKERGERGRKRRGHREREHRRRDEDEI